MSFVHLYWEISWFGVLQGTTLAFLGVYATRQGASPQQVGLLSAVPALAALLFSLPIGGWLARRRLGGAVFWASILQRMVFVFMILLPVLLLPALQVWVIILLSFLMTIPGTVMTVGFNTLFAEVVPLDWRGHVMGLRMALLALVTTSASFISGQLLERMAFPIGYQFVFTLGAIGAAMSSYHLFLLVKAHEAHLAEPPCPPAKPESAAARRLNLEISQLYRRGLNTIRLDVLNGRFARVMGLLFFFHFAQFLVIPTVTPYVVNQLHFTDDIIGMATASFNLTTFFGSLMLSTFSARWGNKNVTGFGIMGVSTFPILIAASGSPVTYLLGHIIGGFAWAMPGGGIYNYILDNIPSVDRPAYLAWYSVISNGAILAGSLLGPALAGWIGFPVALMLYGLLRFLAGFAIVKWG